MRRTLTALATVLATSLAAIPAAPRPDPPAAGQASTAAAQTPVFGTAVELVRIDAVVVDRDGRPVNGLTAADFDVSEGGRPQAITSFEPVIVRGTRPQPADEPPRLGAARVRAPSEGRCVLLFVDDIHISPPVAENVRQSLRRFLEADVREGDWVTLFAPVQQLWWTARNAWEYRQLVQVLGQVKGHAIAEGFADWAIVRADEYGQLDAGAASRADNSSATSGGPGRFVLGSSGAAGQEAALAVARRRTGMTLGGLQQALEALVKLRGRKSLVVISEGLFLLPRMPGYAEAIDAARRANVAIHFVDPRGVTADRGGSELALTLEEDGLAQVTGGTVFSGNQTEAGLRRVASESDAYYLLGYEPAQPGRGERQVEVRLKAKREGVTVRARTRYYVAPETPAAPAASPALAAIRSLSDTTDLPLRVSTLFFEPNHKGEIATMLATEVVPPPGKPGERLFKLVSEARARDGGSPVRDQFEGSPRVTPGVPVILARQWNLAPGVWQLRLFVEDTVTGRFGTLVHTFEVPDARHFRMSTPILTAELEDPNGRRKPKVALARTFRTGTIVYCQYNVYGAPAAGRHDWVPHVFGSWALRRDDELVREAPPTLIQPAPDGRVTRTLGISLQGAPPGEYALALTARDEKTGESVTRVEPFTVAP
jgi:VWFA-related protein